MVCRSHQGLTLVFSWSRGQCASTFWVIRGNLRGVESGLAAEDLSVAGERGAGGLFERGEEFGVLERALETAQEGRGSLWRWWDGRQRAAQPVLVPEPA
jgi:hypothetical protein